MNIDNYINNYNKNDSVLENVKSLLVNHSETLDHVKKVSITGKKLANRFNVDAKKVEIACLLHDISAIIPKEKYIEVCNFYNIDINDVEEKIPMILHQKLSQLIAAEFFNIDDSEMLDAISAHTTLKANPTKLDMIVFIADKLSWDQDGIPPFFDVVSSALDISLEKACLVYINYVIDNNMILIPHPDLLSAKAYLESL